MQMQMIRRLFFFSQVRRTGLEPFDLVHRVDYRRAQPSAFERRDPNDRRAAGGADRILNFMGRRSKRDVAFQSAIQKAEKIPRRL